MQVQERTVITVKSIVNASVEKVWKIWNNPDDIIVWCTSNPDWHTPVTVNDLREGGKFIFRMEPTDGSIGYVYDCVYDVVKVNEYIEYHNRDGRDVKITFIANGHQTIIDQSIEVESNIPIEYQRGGWQAIMDNFKKYVESKN